MWRGLGTRNEFGGRDKDREVSPALAPPHWHPNYKCLHAPSAKERGTSQNEMRCLWILCLRLNWLIVWGIDFMGPFPQSNSYLYSFVCVDYVTKWVEAIACSANDSRTVTDFLKKNIFARFGVPRVLISDGGTHFCNRYLERLLEKYYVKHKVSTPYHP